MLVLPQRDNRAALGGFVGIARVTRKGCLMLAEAPPWRCRRDMRLSPILVAPRPCRPVEHPYWNFQPMFCLRPIRRATKNDITNPVAFIAVSTTSPATISARNAASGSEQARAISLASFSPSKIRATAGVARCLRFNAASKPSSTSWSYIRKLVTAGIGKAAYRGGA
jgi:hypothetical protein